jgi:peroxiredoxin
LALGLGHEGDWRGEYKPADDIGQRPNLDNLGPYRWQPYAMPDFVVKDQLEQDVHANSIDRPTLVMFYLGFGCLHCVEQLKAFSPRAEEFSKNGVSLMAISMESAQQLKDGIKGYDKPLEIPLHTDSTLSAFKAMRCYDDFESQPLHGLYLIQPGANGKPHRILWQDIGFEPFMDVDFLLEESKRLLELAK